MSELDVHKLQELGLYDPGMPNGEDRLAVIGFNLEHGVTLDRMVEANKEGRLAYVAEEEVLYPGHRLTLKEGAERAGVSEEIGLEIWRAAGFPDPGPDDKVFTERLVGVMTLLESIKTIFGRDLTLQLVRVYGASMARMAEAETTAFITAVRNPIEEAGGGELAIAQANIQVAQMMPQITEAMDVLHRHHIEAAVRRMLVTADVSGVEQTRRAVGFVDLVGYTSFSSQLPPDQLGKVLADFESRCRDLVTGRGGLVVKLIGDEVMFVAPDAAKACAIALDLIDELESHELLPPARAGVAWGEVLMQDGDYYGQVVNLASRVVNQARPGTLLVSKDTRDVLKEDPSLRAQPIGTRKLKGYRDRIPLYVARRRVQQQQEDATG